MPLTIKHQFESPIADVPADLAAGKVTPSRWNASLSATMSSGFLLGRSAVGVGAVEEIPASSLTIGWGQLTGTPTTLAGYSITDAAPLSHVGAGGGAHANVVAAGAAGFMTGADKSKLDGIAAGATANSPDAALLARANHTGTQTSSTISNFAAAARAETEAALIAGANITITPAGAGATRTLTIASTGGGGGAPAGAAYVTIGNDATLTGERALVGTANRVSVTDGGANGSVTLSTPQDIHTGASPEFANLLLTGHHDITQIAPPANPAANIVRAWIEDKNGRQLYKIKGSQGLERVVTRDNIFVARNTSGSLIARGRAITITGSTGQTPNFSLADAASAVNVAHGIAAEDIAHNGFGFVVVVGNVDGLDTSALAEGAVLYLSTTAGASTATPPAHPNMRQVVGLVLRQHATQGIIAVDIGASFGSFEGTRQNSFAVGDAAVGTKSLLFRNASTLTLSAAPTAPRTLTLPDATGTLELVGHTQAWSTITATPTTLGGYGITDAVPSARTVSTTAPLSGGGALSGNLTLSITANGIDNTLLRQGAAASVIGRAAGTTGNVADIAAAADNQVLARAGGSLSFQQVSGAMVATNAIGNAQFRQGGALSVVGVTGNATANVADITAGVDGHVLRRSGTALGFGTLAAGAFAANTIPVASISQNTARLLGRTTASAGSTEEITVSSPLTFSSGVLGVQTFGAAQAGVVPASGGGTTSFLRADGTWAVPAGGSADGLGPDGDKGDVTVGGTGTTLTIDNDAVTYAKMQDVSATSRFIGRITAGSGDPEELTGTQATTLLDNFTATLKGLVPGSGGGTTNFLRADGTWSAPPGGSGAPGGSSGQVQHNNAGAFGGAAATEIGTEGTLQLVAGSVPAAPSSGRVKLFAQTRAARTMPAFISPSGLDVLIQPAIFANRIGVIAPNRTTTVSNFGCGSQVGATASHPTPTTNSMAESLYRTRFQTTAVAGNASGVRSDQQVVRGNGTTGRGGFYHAARFCTGNIALSGGQFFCGLQGGNVLLAGEPSALLNLLAVGKDVADTNLQFMRNDGAGSATKVDLGIAYAANIALQMRVFCPPSSSEIWVLIERINNDGTLTTLLETSYTTDIPATTTFLAMHCQVRNGSIASAANVEMVQMYVESDF